MGAGSVLDWVSVDGRQVGCRGNCGEYREGQRVVAVDTFYTYLAQRYTVNHWTLRASVSRFRRVVAWDGIVDSGSSGSIAMEA